jgi:hypothetical protein
MEAIILAAIITAMTVVVVVILGIRLERETTKGILQRANQDEPDIDAWRRKWLKEQRSLGRS